MIARWREDRVPRFGEYDGDGVPLRHGGIEALRDLLEEWRMQQGKARVYVVDEAGRELLGRTVSAEAVAQARRLADGDH